MKMRIPILSVLFVMLASAAFGQATNSADLTGTVTDASGAVIPGATITVQNIDKATQHVVTTDGAGIYDTGPLVPDDRYTITYTKQGFGSVQRGPMTLRIGIIGMNVQLNVGQTTQQVVVDESAPLLETTTSELSTTLPSETLQVLPQTGAPDWQGFLVLLPGVNGVQQNGNSAGNPGMGGAAANGSLPFSTALLDGASTSSPMSNNVLYTPIFDAIAEVKVSDSLFSAQYGIGGMLFMQISKGGTNKFHGVVYDYLRNSSFNAASYAFGKGVVSPLHYNDIGFNVGGPILKNRLYFFFGFERPINHGAPASQTFITVPTNAMRNGDFTGLPTIYDPTTQTVVNGVVTRLSFADEYGNGNKIPASMLDTVAKNIQALYPAPTPGLGTVSNGVTLNNFAYLIPTVTPSAKYFGRFDADMTKTNRITGSAAWNYQTNPSVTPVCPINCAL
jgi:hypothetical protein